MLLQRARIPGEVEGLELHLEKENVYKHASCLSFIPANVSHHYWCDLLCCDWHPMTCPLERKKLAHVALNTNSHFLKAFTNRPQINFKHNSLFSSYSRVIQFCNLSFYKRLRLLLPSKQ